MLWQGAHDRKPVQGLTGAQESQNTCRAQMGQRPLGCGCERHRAQRFRSAAYADGNALPQGWRRAREKRTMPHGSHRCL